MRKWMILPGMLVLILAGCSSKEHNNTGNSVMKEVKVEVKTAPEKLEANKKVEVQALVTQDGKAVEDAESVKFEIWKEGSEKHDMLTAKHKDGSVYAADETFSEDGVYHIIAHTNARDMHTMPEVKVTVGTGQAAAAGGQHNDSAHEHGKAAITLHAGEPQAKKKTDLLADVRYEEKPLAGAKVQFEIWKGSSKHEYIAAVDAGNGQYKAQYTFPEAGSYQVKTHVENTTLHEHVEQALAVK
ncbi:FixH family protein [Ectobacillus ponti]|uniref:FixH family protein n=1 Tax=Ectobacillus ponti TaxID=2961894 RepID=A0AA41X0Z5_9BACI|nr:FixH family protein [Ectobacillus ponti]MCP8966959.1 FixH family protein [Ectobacillus ponti]